MIIFSLTTWFLVLNRFFYSVQLMKQTAANRTPRTNTSLNQFHHPSHSTADILKLWIMQQHNLQILLYWVNLLPIFINYFLTIFFFKFVSCMYVYRFQNFALRCPTPRLHCFLSSHWPSCRFLSFMAFLIPSIQFFFGLPRALFCFGIHFNAILGNLPSAILWTWQCQLDATR